MEKREKTDMSKHLWDIVKRQGNTVLGAPRKGISSTYAEFVEMFYRNAKRFYG